MGHRGRRVPWLVCIFVAAGWTPSAADDRQADVPPSWWAATQRAIADAEYGISLQPEGWQAPNPAQGFRTHFTDGGIRVTPRSASAASWKWELRFARWGRAASMIEALPAQLTVTANEAVYDRQAVVERYVNDRRGLEQIFDIAEPPGERAGPVHLDLELSGTLSPVISEDAQAIDFQTPAGVRVLRYAALHVVDARGETLPAWMEGLCEPGLRGIRLVYDDSEAVYPVTVDPLATTAAWIAESNQANAWFGMTVATAGDVNADGYSDVVVGALLYDNGQSNEGRAFLYLGSPSGLASTAAWTAEGNLANAEFANEVGPAGDVNGDGYDDVLIGEHRYANGQFEEGRAFLYLGSAAGLATTAAWTVEGDQVDVQLGTSVATAGDVNGDGYADVIVGAEKYDNGHADEGRAYLYLGSATGLGTASAWSAESNQAAARFGYSVATAGDVNGDGYADVIVGARRFDNGQADEGRVYLYLGSASGLATTAAWTQESDQVGAEYGTSVATAGDVNGDGHADVVVGAHLYGNGEVDEGRAYVYHGSPAGLASSAAHVLEIDQEGAGFGSSVAPAGDVNGDGYADVVIGAPLFDLGFLHAGAAALYLGSASGLSEDPAWVTIGGQASAQHGISVATAGDVNGDGFADVIIGAYGDDNGQTDEGRAHTYHGSASGLSTGAAWIVESDQTNAILGWSLATAGDVNGDGYSDVIVAAPNHDNGQLNEGRVLVYHGSASGPSPIAAWIAESDQQSAGFGYDVAPAGDVNGDGYSDVVIGSYSWGRASVYHGSTAGLSTNPAWTAEGDQAGALFGTAVATAGDVNGDGYSDLIVGASPPSGAAGRAYVYLGSSAGLSRIPAWTAEGQVGAQFGSSVGTAGDVNGDGYSDVVVGAFNYDNGQSNEGGAFVYLGSATGLAATPAWTAEANQQDSLFGLSVATAGDVNGDGYSDLIVGAAGFDNDQVNEGRAFVYLGSASGLGASAAWTAESHQFNSYFSGSVATAGDVNGDGYSDIVVGAMSYGNGEALEGRAYVYLGSPSGPGLLAAWTVESNQQQTALGRTAVTAGDVNGDGYADVIVGCEGCTNGQSAEGRAFLYYGGGGENLDRIPRQARTDATTPVALLGKSDSESEFRLRARGRTPAGRGMVRVEWEVKPLGALFDGTGIGSSPSEPTSLPGAAGSVTSFNEPVTGLDEGIFYHWRLRLASTDPFFPRSPWVSLAGNNRSETKLRTAGCVDLDGDGYGVLGDASCASLVPDCDDHDETSWDTPGETQSLRFTSKTAMSWELPADPGSPPSELIYDTLRSGIAGSFLLGECIESDDGPDRTASDLDVPSAGQVFFYLTRAQNSCPQADGSLGTDSAGNERLGPSCP